MPFHSGMASSGGDDNVVRLQSENGRGATCELNCSPIFLNSLAAPTRVKGELTLSSSHETVRDAAGVNNVSGDCAGRTIG